MFTELQIVREIMQIESDTLIDILNYIKRIDSFPNIFIDYKIMLTSLVSIALAKRKILN